MPQELKIKARDEDLKGVYANLMIVSHTKDAFCLDFINAFQPPVLVSRILTNPSHLKKMIAALQENLKKYEQKYGTVSQDEEDNIQKIGFQI